MKIGNDAYKSLIKQQQPPGTLFGRPLIFTEGSGLPAIDVVAYSPIVQSWDEWLMENAFDLIQEQAKQIEDAIEQYHKKCQKRHQKPPEAKTRNNTDPLPVSTNLSTDPNHAQ